MLFLTPSTVPEDWSDLDLRDISRINSHVNLKGQVASFCGGFSLKSLSAES